MKSSSGSSLLRAVRLSWQRHYHSLVRCDLPALSRSTPDSSCASRSPRISALTIQSRHFTSAPQTNAPLAGAPQPTGDVTGVRPLEGITVVTLEQAIAGPFCSRQLADLGARVIKVERPGKGDFARDYDTRVNGLCSHFVWVNRNKESLALDLKNAKDLAVLKQLLARVDVLVQNLAPGATDRLGLSYDGLKEVNSKLIVCDISGYGSYGPYTKKKAYDLLIQSEAGMLSVTGTKDSPAKVGASIADIAAGMYAYSNIMAALLQRGKTGQGCRIDVSMLESMVEWMGFPMYYSYEGAPPPPRAGASHASIYPYGPFEAGDGKSAMLGIQNEREWTMFCERVLEKPEVTADPRFEGSQKRSDNREALKQIIEGVFSKNTADEVVERLEAAGIANAKVNEMHEVWNHPQLKARGRWSQVETPVGPIPTLIPPGMASNVPPRMDAIPKVGDHNLKILAELGMGP